MAPEKIDSFVPENFQGFLSHYLGVFVPGTSVPLSGRILPTGKFSESFVPLYCQRWRPKKLTILFQKTFRDFCPTIWAYLCQGLLSHYLDVYCQQENFQRFLSHYTAKDGTRKIGNFVPENFQGFLFHYLGVFVPGTSVPLSGRVRIWFQETFQRFLSHYTAKDGAQKKKVDNFAPENFQGFLSHYLGVFVPGASVPLSGRILPTGKFSEIFVPLYCQRWRPKKLTILFQKTFRDFCPTIWAYLCQGLLSHHLDVYCQQENFQRFLSHYTAKDGTRKIGNFVPENFQGFLSHYLGVFVPGTSVPLSGRILPKMAPKKWPIWFQENFQRFLSHYLGVYWGRWRPKNGHLVLKGIFSEAAAAAFSVFSNMVDCSYFAFFDAFVVCCLRPSPSSSSWTSPP